MEQEVGEGSGVLRTAFVGINKCNCSFVTYFICGRMSSFGLFTARRHKIMGGDSCSDPTQLTFPSPNCLRACLKSVFTP